MRSVRGSIQPPPDLGELLTKDEIAERFFRGLVSPRTAARKMPRDRVVKVGRAFAWYEADVREAMAGLRGAA